VSKELDGIAKRIRREIAELDKTREHALRRWQKALKDEDYLGSVGFDLQSFYQGVERVFGGIAKRGRGRWLLLIVVGTKGR
jgi:hypothetical protein